jgi:hypothetical protein
VRKERAAARAVLGAFAFTAIYFSGFFPPGDNPNELSRFEAIYSIVEHGTFSIDPARAALGDTQDKSVARGRFYSNKAPGLILAGAPVYGLLRLALPRPGRGTDGVFYLVRFFTVTLVSLVALARFARRLAERNPAAAPAILFAAAFGTPFAFYARSFFSHAWTAALLFLAWDALRAGEDVASARASRSLFVLSGFLAGFAAISEYPAAPIALFLGARAAVRGLRPAAALAAGALPPVLFLLAYDAACFGSPFTLSSAREADPGFAALAARGLFGVGLPSPRTAWRLLFHPARGAVLFSPFLLWTIPAAAAWRRSREARADLLFVAGSLLYLFASISAYPHWEGGWSLGARYLLPALFLCAAALPWALDGSATRSVFAAAAVFSAANFFLIAGTYPHTPDAMPWPAATLAGWLVVRGASAPNAGTALGIPAALSLVPPALALAAAGLSALRVLAGPRPRRAVVLAAAGLAVFAATLAFPPRISDGMRAWRNALANGLRAPRGGRVRGETPHIIDGSP